MKFLIYLSVFVLNVAADSEIITNDLSNLNNTITDDILQQLVDNYQINRGGEIIANINEYADEVFKKVQKLIIRTGLDPVEMPDQFIKIFPSGTVNLTRGWLEDTSTLMRYNDVEVSYSSSTKKVTFVVPIKFDSLMVVYKYVTKILLISATGDIEGKVSNIRANIRLTFDFDKYVADLDSLDITDTGRISVTFSGNGILDWITSTITNTVSVLLHPIIIRIIQAMVKGGLDKTVEAVNEAINNFLHK